MSLSDELKERVIVYDGAMGTLLQESGALKVGGIPEELNLSDPDAIRGVHKMYIDAGADVIETNSFGGHRLKLKNFGLEDKFKDINAAAVKIAKSAAGSYVYVAAGIGPYEKMVEPLGPITFDEAVEMYKEWVEVVSNSGADIILFETFSDIKELKAAVIAAKSVCDLPIQVQMTYEGGERTLSGTPPEVVAVTFEAMGVDVIGMNCSCGPKELIPAVKRVAEYCDAYISVLPNAGLPVLIDGRTVFPQTPEEMAAFAEDFISGGANIIGGCCGTTPDHIRAVKEKVRGKRPAHRRKKVGFALASRTKVVFFDEKRAPLIIGERINPTGKKAFAQELRDGRTTGVRRFALEQVRNGADMLDVNVGASGVDEAVMIKRAVAAVQAVADLPVVIDSVNPVVIESGLKEACGKPLINSVNGEEKSIMSVMPLAKKYGAALLGLTTDENGLAKDIDNRVRIAGRIKEKAAEYGIYKDDIVIDTLAMTISVDSAQAKYTLRAIEKIVNELELLTSLGVSNVSFGLPHRDIINARFFSLAIGAGLSMGIINPNNEKIMQVAKNRIKEVPTDENIDNFIRESLELQFKEIEIPVIKKESVSSENVEEKLREAILYGEKDVILELVEIALKKGLKPLDINLKILIPAIEEVGDKFEKKEYFLPQIIMAAEAMQKACNRLNSELGQAEDLSKGSVIMATVEGDIHDIGKNIVIAVLESYGYKVYDLGRDVKCDEIVSAVKDKKVRIVGLSALMTTTMVNMEPVIKELNKYDKRIKVMVGGAAVTKRFSEEIGANGFAANAIEAVKLVENFLKGNENET